MNEKLVRSYLEIGIIAMGYVMKSEKDIMNVILEKVYQYVNNEKEIRNNPFDHIHIGDVSKCFSFFRDDIVEYT